MGWDAIADYYIYRPLPIYEPPQQPPPIPQVSHEERQETTEETDAFPER